MLSLSTVGVTTAQAAPSKELIPDRTQFPGPAFVLGVCAQAGNHHIDVHTDSKREPHHLREPVMS